MTRDGNRLVIVGSPGFGKSTLANELGAILNMEVFDLDPLVWKVSLVRAPIADQVRMLGEILGGERWIVDGDHPDTQRMRFMAANTIIFMDFPWPVCLWRLIGRAISGWRKRPDVSKGITSTLTVRVKAHAAMLIRVLAYPGIYRPRVLENLHEFSVDRHVVILRRPADVRQYIEAIARSSVQRPLVRISESAGVLETTLRKSDLHGNRS